MIEFDGNGRMYVAEFVTYMPDVEGTGQHEPRSRISRWEDTNGDGTFDKRTVFVDKLVLPRMILPLDNDSILTNETASDDVVKWTDTNNDGVADKREVFYTRRRRRPRRQPRARAERVRVGPRQLDLQHLQLLPLPLDADRRRPRDRPARTAVSGA